MARTTGMWSYARVSFDTHKKRWFADGAGVDATGTPPRRPVRLGAEGWEVCGIASIYFAEFLPKAVRA
jgi:hypothetical protein